MMHRVGPRRWIARIALTWGALSAAMMFVQGDLSFYMLRFLLGIAEAGPVSGADVHGHHVVLAEAPGHRSRLHLPRADHRARSSAARSAAH